MTKTIEYLKWRASVKKFDATKKLSPEKMHIVTESLRLSPSSFGMQCWKFIIIEDMSLREKLKPHTENQHQVTDASALIVLCRKISLSGSDVDKHIKNISKTRQVTIESLSGYADRINSLLRKATPEKLELWLSTQVFIALGMLLSACATEGIDTCPIGGFSPKGYDEVLQLEKKNLISVVLCAVGYRHAEDRYSSFPKVRYAEEDVIIKL